MYILCLTKDLKELPRTLLPCTRFDSSVLGKRHMKLSFLKSKLNISNSIQFNLIVLWPFIYPRKEMSVYEVLGLPRPCHIDFKYSVEMYTLYKEATAKLT